VSFNNSDNHNTNNNNVYGVVAMAQPLINAKQGQLETDHQIKSTDFVLFYYYFCYITIQHLNTLKNINSILNSNSIMWFCWF